MRPAEPEYYGLIDQEIVPVIDIILSGRTSAQRLVPMRLQINGTICPGNNTIENKVDIQTAVKEGTVNTVSDFSVTILTGMFDPATLYSSHVTLYLWFRTTQKIIEFLTGTIVGPITADPDKETITFDVATHVVEQFIGYKEVHD